MSEFDVILVGGGLANGLIADRLLAQRPNLSVIILDSSDRVGGDHTWSYHASDVTPEQDAWLRRFCIAVWPSQEVQFPAYRRSLSTGYRTMVSRNLRERLSSRDSLNLRLATRVQDVYPDHIVLGGGEKLSARCVIDGRGMTAMPGVSLGYQKFLGMEVETAEPHGLVHPILMDARVEQLDGYRFIYCLPYSETVLLIEDTYYSDQSEFDCDIVRARLNAYAVEKGWRTARLLREESGILPVVLDGKLSMIWPESSASAATKSARSGMRAGLFHHTTGYSLPFAASAAEKLALLTPLTTTTAMRCLRACAEIAWQRQSFFRLLNRLLFIAADGGQRRRVFERFYRLPQPLIERFYAADLTVTDKARILVGRPPVSVGRAIGAISPKAAASRRTTSPAS
ncbi:MAG: lycopene beta-cyclase CrtY [Hyphomicrobiaceae bacterium]